MDTPRLFSVARLPRWKPLPWVVVLGYFLVFLLLDWASFIRPLEGLNITAWNPQAALAVALLLASRRLWWVVLAALMAAEVLVRGVPGDFFVVAMAAGALTCSYLAIAAALEQRLGDGWRFGGGRDVARFMAVIAAGALLSGLVYVGTYAAGGFTPGGTIWAAIARYWVGDAVGLTVTLPILLSLMDAERRQRLQSALRHPQAWLIGAVIVVLLWLLLGRGSDRFDFSYLLLLPVIWASMRFGASGAVLASLLTQVGLIVAFQSGPHADRFVFELQLLMTTITITALLLGVMVDERARADQELRRTLRLAAAGQMSAALAHELGQPLSALGLYAQACEVLAAPGRALTAEDNARLLEVVRRMAGDARRAGDVVKRLRDFFRSGSMQLAPLSMRALIEEAIRAEAPRVQGSGARLTSSIDAPLPPVWADVVQIQVVLRNLLANALDAALDPGVDGRAGRPAEVKLSASVGARDLLLVVSDSGPGLRAAQAQAIFEPASEGVSRKVGGMGVGLSICRAIVEAHGGRLWAEPGPSGRFCFSLPLGNPMHDAERATPPAA